MHTVASEYQWMQTSQVVAPESGQMQESQYDGHWSETSDLQRFPLPFAVTEHSSDSLG